MNRGYSISRVVSSLLAVFVFAAFSGCASLPLAPKSDAVYLPFIKNSPNECYYIDDFMPVPDGIVKGKTGALSIRYYSYKSATYKDWQQKHVILSFYSQDDRCWSLFEEYYVNNN